MGGQRLDSETICQRAAVQSLVVLSHAQALKAMPPAAGARPRRRGIHQMVMHQVLHIQLWIAISRTSACLTPKKEMGKLLLWLPNLRDSAPSRLQLLPRRLLTQRRQPPGTSPLPLPSGAVATWSARPAGCSIPPGPSCRALCCPHRSQTASDLSLPSAGKRWRSSPCSPSR